MGAYAYEAPSNLSDAIALLDDHAKEGKRAQILACHLYTSPSPRDS